MQDDKKILNQGIGYYQIRRITNLAMAGKISISQVERHNIICDKQGREVVIKKVQSNVIKLLYGCSLCAIM